MKIISVTMKTLLLLSSAIILLLPLYACSPNLREDRYEAGYQQGYKKGWQEGYKEGLGKESTTVPAQTPITTLTPIPIQRKITLTDAPDVLYLLPILPTKFEKVDAASEGLSNADLKLGADCSEVELFLSDDPFQMIYGFMYIAESRIERAGFDSIMKDELKIKKLIIENIKAGANKEGVEIQEPTIKISYPIVGDMSLLGEGYFSSYGMEIGFDTLWVRMNKVYIIIYSAYYSLNRQQLLPIGKELARRVSLYSQ